MLYLDSHGRRKNNADLEQKYLLLNIADSHPPFTRLNNLYCRKQIFYEGGLKNAKTFM